MTIKPLVQQNTIKRNSGVDADSTDHGIAAEQTSQFPTSVSVRSITVHAHRSATIDVHSSTSHRRNDLIDGITRRSCRSPHNKSNRSKRRELSEYAFVGVNVTGIPSTKSSTPSTLSNNRSLSPKNTDSIEHECNDTSDGIAECVSQIKSSNSSLATLTTQTSDEAYSGYNSGDEHNQSKDAGITVEEWRERDEQFSKLVKKLGFELRPVEEDGACLFRAISLQIFGDEEMHFEVRQKTMDYISQNQEYYSQFVTEDIDNYIKRKRRKDSHGNHIEIQAMSEMYMRPIELYSYHHAEPMNVYNLGMHKNGCTPLRLSYQRSSHYNAILDPFNGTVGEGLGLPSYQPQLQTHDALRLSEQDAIEQTMFEDKLKSTDWEATNEAMEEQIARESYLQWCRDNLKRNRAGTTSTVTSAEATVVASDFLGFSGKENAALSTTTSTEADIGFKVSVVGSSNNNSTESANTDILETCDDGNETVVSSNSSTVTGFTPAQQDIIGLVPKNKFLRGSVGRINKKRRHELFGNETSTNNPEIVKEKSPKRESPHQMISTDKMKSTKRAVTPEAELPSTSKHVNAPVKITDENDTKKANDSTTFSTFYQDLLEASYSANGEGQMSESELLQRAIQMSTIDYIAEQKRKYLF